MFSMDKYVPIDCNFHDGLLAKISLRKRVNIQYRVDGKVLEKETYLKDVYTKEKEEFLVMEDGETIRLDQIVSVELLPLP